MGRVNFWRRRAGLTGWMVVWRGHPRFSCSLFALFVPTPGSSPPETRPSHTLIQLLLAPARGAGGDTLRPDQHGGGHLSGEQHYEVCCVALARDQTLTHRLAVLNSQQPINPKNSCGQGRDEAPSGESGRRMPRDRILQQPRFSFLPAYEPSIRRRTSHSGALHRAPSFRGSADGQIAGNGGVKLCGIVSSAAGRSVVEGGKCSDAGRREVQGSKRLMYNILLVITDGVRGAAVSPPRPRAALRPARYSRSFRPP